MTTTSPSHNNNNNNNNTTTSGNTTTSNNETNNTASVLVVTRRTLLRTALIALSSFLLLRFPNMTPPVHAATAAQLERLITPIVMCQRLMTPVDKYITDGAWDKGRTNVNYCTRVLAMRRNMKDAAQLLQGDAYYDALDIMGDMENIMSQLDASLYTPLFIPADEGDITPEQSKYQTQARGFYMQAVDGFDRFLKLVPDDVLVKATDLANNAKYEINIEHS